MKNRRLRLSVGAVLTAAAVSGVAVGQEKEVLLEEIIVTAERRAQSLQEVPLSITAFGAETRDTVGILTIQDMANFAPGVSYNTSLDRPSIRGVGRQSNTFSIDSPVANYFDGVYTTSVQDASRRPIFIERTEILRGPQGALSGRGSVAGAINTISKRPKDEWGGEVRVLGGNYQRYGAEATVTGPITDWLRFRVNLGDYNQEEGYFKNIATGNTEGDQPNNRSIQDYMVDIDIGESIDLFLKASFANYDETRRIGYTTAPYSTGNLASPNPAGVGTGSAVPIAAYGYFAPGGSTRVGTQTQNPVITTGDVRKFANDFHSRQWLDDQHAYVADLVWHAPILDVRWIGGHNNYKYTQLEDADGTDVLTMVLPFTGRVVSPGGISMYQEEREWYSNELTFTSTTDGAFSWIFGLYQSNEQYVQTPLAATYKGYAELNTPLYAPGVPAPVNPFPFTSTRGSLDGETISSAAFGQVDYQLTDAWKFTLGLRYNKDEKEVTEMTRLIGNNYGTSAFYIGQAYDITGSPGVLPAVDQTVPGVVADRGINPVTGYRERDLKGEWTATTGSAGVDFTPTDDDLIYLRVAMGYRPGGFNAGFVDGVPMIDKESVTSFEVGYKTTLFNRLLLSTSAFYYDYEDIQLQLPVLARCTVPGDASSCSVVNTFVNIPSAESIGLELEANWAATDHLSVVLNYGYLDATIKDGSAGYLNSADPAAILQNAKPISTPNGVDTNYTYLPRYVQDISGNKMNDVPEHKVAANVNYLFNFNAHGTLNVSVSGVWRDSSYQNLFEMKESQLPSYTTVGARLAWTNEANTWGIMVYGTNLTDAEAVDGATTARRATGLATSTANASAQGAAYFHEYSIGPPREFGLEMQFRMGGR